MKVVVAGGSGFVGRIAVKDLVENNEIKEICILDYNVEGANELAKEFGNKVSARFIDITDEQALYKSIVGFDMLINTVGPFYLYAAHVLKACIKASVHYVDVCDDYDATELLLTYDDECRQAGITAITGCGVSPGVTNMLALLGANKMDEVDEIHISWVENVADAGGQGVLWHAIHMCHGDIPQYLNGNLKHVPALSSTVETNFMEPLGKYPVHFVGHPEPLTLPKYIPNLKIVTNRGNIYPEDLENIIKPFVELGLTSTETIKVQDKEIIMRDFVASYLTSMLNLDEENESLVSEAEVHFALKVQVKGKKDETKINYVFDGHMDDTNQVTAFAATGGANLIGFGHVTQRGVFAPEGCLDPEQFFDYLAERKITYRGEENSSYSVENVMKLL